MGDQHQKQERIPNPELENKEVEKLEELEGETLSMRFLALAVSHTVSPSSRSRHTELTRRRSRSLEESLATIKRKKTCKTRKSLLRRSKLGESLVKMQQKTSLPTEVTSSKIIEETTTRSTLDSAKVFGRKFSASLDNFASLSLRESRVEEEEEEVGDSETFRACNKRKREETPLQEEYLQPLACGAQARLGLEDVTADELAGYLEDTTFFPKRMSCMAEMMYT